jgi:hypothetical protein
MVGFPQDKPFYDYLFLIYNYFENYSNSNSISGRQRNSIGRDPNNAAFIDINRNIMYFAFVPLYEIHSLLNKFFKQLSVLAIPFGGRAPPAAGIINN